jgi:Protein of unknown function (DUF3987)
MKFIDDFVSYNREFTGCPELFLRWSALLALSAVAGYKHVHRRGNWDVRPNLWVLILGNSSSYKSTGLSSMRRLLYEACPGVLASQEYSHEALIEDIATNPHRVFLYDEAESYFKMLSQKYNAPMRSAMMSMYNGAPMQRKIKGKDGTGETHTIDHSYICWGGASTPFQISTHLNGSTTDLLSGMFPRFVMVPYFGPESSIEDPPPDDKRKRAALVDHLRKLAVMGEREYAYTPAALAAKSAWLARFNKRANSADVLLSAFYRKMRDEHIHKVAMLSAFERESHVMDESDVTCAIQLLWPVEKEWGNLLERLTEKEWDREAKRVEEFVKSKKVCDRSDILRSCRGIRAQKLTAILAGFHQDKQMRVYEKETSGRTRWMVEWTGD